MVINSWSLSYAAVNAFFILSGFLIADSLERRRDVFLFAASRALRILPALLFLSLFAVLVVGPLATSLSPGDYWTASSTWLFPVNVMAFLDTSSGPAGVFGSNPWSGEFSATLWTLRYEVVAYIAAGTLFFSPIPWGRYTHLVIFILTSGVYIFVRYEVEDAPALVMAATRLSSAFTLGMLIHGWRNHVSVVPLAGLLSLPIWLVLEARPEAEIVMNIMMASFLFWLAFARLWGLPTWAKIPDWSYGIYIWHYPIMQSVLYFNIAETPIMIGAISLPLSVLVAAFSWSFIEKPCLHHKAAFGTWLVRIYQKYSV